MGQTNPTIYIPNRTRSVFVVESAGGQFSGCWRNYASGYPTPPDSSVIPIIYYDAYVVVPDMLLGGPMFGRFCNVAYEDVFSTTRMIFNGCTASSCVAVLHQGASPASILRWTDGRSVAGPNTLQGFAWNHATGDPEGFDWGIGLIERAAWDPKLLLTYDAITTDPLPPEQHFGPGTSTRPYTLSEITDDPANWSLEQFPYGGTREIFPDITAGNSWGHGQTRPCWILSNECWPIFGESEVQTTLVAWSHGYGGSPSYTAVYHQDLFWFTPDHDEAWTPTTYWDWLNDLAPEAIPEGYYYMGCPNYWDYKWRYAAPRENEGTSLHFGSMPAAWNPDYPEYSDERQPSRGSWSSTSWFGLDFRTMSTQVTADGFNSHMPHCKHDAGFRIPGFEFSRPSWVDTLQALGECVVLSATAEVYVADVRRHEMKFLFEQPPTPTPGFVAGVEHENVNQFELPYMEPGRYGFLVYQKSFTGTGATVDGEEWVLRMKVTNTVTGTGPALVDSDNTHTYWTVFRQAVLDATGEWPRYQGELVGMPDPASTPGGVPKYIPRKTPWYPSTSEHWVDDITELVGAKLGHCLIGLQQWADETGGTPGSLDVPRSKKEMTRAVFWQPKATSGPTFDYEVPPMPADAPVNAPFNVFNGQGCIDGETHGDPFDLDAYLDWLLDENTDRVTELQNYRYRWLAHEPASGDEGGDNIIPDDEAWHSVDMTAIFDALLADVTAGESKTRLNGGGSYAYGPHTKFRIYPCLPKTPSAEQVAGCKYDGVFLNVAPLFVNMQPDLDWRGDDGAGSPFERHTPTYDNVIYQQFSDWRIRSITATIQKPDLSTVEVTIPTPWG